ncbi:DDE domain-containing protein [Halopenitus persicus]|uniref:DDE domain-containing protein n=1 Tax=Halopenitus persicus TaxID=1048396 RepID=A0A1H3K1H0_9EURY|nr:DDE domain-containing protein [Halopenitus persicus]
MNDQRYWLFAATDPDSSRLLHVRLFSTRTSALTEIFLAELQKNHLIDDAIFLVDGAPWLQAACHRHLHRFQHVIYGNRNTVEHVFKRLKHRTAAFANHFRHADRNTAETLLQAFDVCFNQLL